MEFRDDHGTRIFFKLQDQLKIADNETLEFLMSMIRESKVNEEADFYNKLNIQMEENLKRNEEERN